MNKSELRKAYKIRRQALSQETLDDLSLAIANRLLTLDIWDYSFYHLFLPITEQKEINTEYLLHILNGKDKQVVLSKSNFKDYSMTHFLLTDSTKIQKNKFGIPEPDDGIEIKAKQIEVVFIPLLAFDSKGHRIGYGKGFYDRFLTECPSSLKIGLSFFEAETEAIEHSHKDVKMDFCVTPNRVYTF